MHTFGWKNVLRILLLLLIAFTGKAQSPTISGRLIGFEKQWKPRLYISRLNSINEFYQANAALRITSVPIDSNGEFHLSTSVLGSKMSFYRLYLLPRNANVSESIRLSPCNFMLLLLNDTCFAHITVPRADLTMRYSVESNLKANQTIAVFLSRFFNGKVRNNQLVFPDEDTSAKQMKTFIASHDPILGLVAYRQFYLYDQRLNANELAFWNTNCERLSNQYPELSYTRELQDIISRNNPVESRVSGWIIFLAILLGLFVVVLIYFLRRKSQATPSGSSRDDEKIGLLTMRERAILQRIGEGRGNQEIADELHIEISTVKTHIRSIYRKLEINSRKEVMRFLQWL